MPPNGAPIRMALPRAAKAAAAPKCWLSAPAVGSSSSMPSPVGLPLLSWKTYALPRLLLKAVLDHRQTAVGRDRHGAAVGIYRRGPLRWAWTTSTAARSGNVELPCGSVTVVGDRCRRADHGDAAIAGQGHRATELVSASARRHRIPVCASRRAAKACRDRLYQQGPARSRSPPALPRAPTCRLRKARPRTPAGRQNRPPFPKRYCRRNRSLDRNRIWRGCRKGYTNRLRLQMGVPVLTNSFSQTSPLAALGPSSQVVMTGTEVVRVDFLYLHLGLGAVTALPVVVEDERSHEDLHPNVEADQRVAVGELFEACAGPLDGNGKKTEPYLYRKEHLPCPRVLPGA